MTALQSASSLKSKTPRSKRSLAGSQPDLAKDWITSASSMAMPPLTGRDGYVFATVYNATPQERIRVVKSGVEPSMVGDIAARLSTSTSFVMAILGFKRSTIARKQADTGAKLSLEDSEKLLGLAKLIGQVEVMVKESGNFEDFDAGKWLTSWLNESVGALGGDKPAQYMDTNEGQAVVSNLLLQIQHGVYA
jgi:uncharacterized protein (DUF2384 family)